jgi:hypothetical protein
LLYLCQFSVFSIATLIEVGRVALDELVENAVIITSLMSLKN